VWGQVKAVSAASALASVALLLAAACSDLHKSPTTPSTGEPPPFNPTGATATVLAVGDIGMCSERVNVEKTAALVAGMEGVLLLAGDLAYMHGSYQDFMDCFDPAWGRFRNRWRPVPGNHEYETNRGAGYLEYFGAAAAPSGRMYYSFRAGDWLILMLDSNDSVGPASDQYAFVTSALTTNGNLCVMAVWHHPLFSSGPNGPNTFMRDIWRLLYEHRADVVITAHDHLYERFGKQDANGRSDARGLRQFIVGTGGATLYDFRRQAANSQVQHRSHGVLRLRLQTNSYSWEFVDVSGQWLDVNSDACH
jgi:3',5'-cyclic AMP phosphodiesterase CpdA